MSRCELFALITLEPLTFSYLDLLRPVITLTAPEGADFVQSNDNMYNYTLEANKSKVFPVDNAINASAIDPPNIPLVVKVSGEDNVNLGEVSK